jgi:hypothetical protein
MQGCSGAKKRARRSTIIYSLNVLGFSRSSRAQTVPPCLRPLIQSGDGFCFGSGTIGSFTVSSVSIFFELGDVGIRLRCIAVARLEQFGVDDNHAYIRADIIDLNSLLVIIFCSNMSVASLYSSLSMSGLSLPRAISPRSLSNSALSSIRGSIIGVCSV